MVVLHVVRQELNTIWQLPEHYLMHHSKSNALKHVHMVSKVRVHDSGPWFRQYKIIVQNRESTKVQSALILQVVFPR